MIHITPEGQILSVGLNLTFGTLRKPYLTLRWVWYNTRTRMLSSRRFRIRLYRWPVFMWSKDERHAVKSWLWENDFSVLPNSVLEDHAPQLRALAELYRLNDYPHSLDGLVLFRGGAKKQ